MTNHENTEKVWQAVKAHFDREHIPPTRRELAQATGLSRTTVGFYLEELQEQGRLIVTPQHRGIQLCER